ncbi:Protein R74.8 a [Aphelenchoides avenae]|nr:Protein R74.8 a [Aphelenchus avenae]
MTEETASRKRRQPTADSGCPLPDYEDSDSSDDGWTTGGWKEVQKRSREPSVSTAVSGDDQAVSASSSPPSTIPPPPNLRLPVAPQQNASKDEPDQFPDTDVVLMDASTHAKRGVKIRRISPKDRIVENISVMESGRVEPIRAQPSDKFEERGEPVRYDGVFLEDEPFFEEDPDRDLIISMDRHRFLDDEVIEQYCEPQNDVVPSPQLAQPRYPGLNFQSLLKRPDDVIFASHRANFGNRRGYELHKPLGCIYEPGTRQWIITDTTSNNIRFFDTREKMNGTRLHLGDGKDGLCYPSAIALLDAGESFAVLDNSGIWQYDMRNEQFLRPVIFPGAGYRRTNDYRGLAVTMDRKYATIRSAGLQSKIFLYSTKGTDEVVAEIEYSVPYLGKRPNPSFLDTCRNRLCITDLGTGAFTVYKYSKHNKVRTLTPVVQLRCQADARRRDGKFEYISGVRLDENNEMWICDASGYSVQWLDKDGGFRSRLRFDDDFCYTSGFAVNTADRQLLACDRRNSMARLYDLSSESVAALRRMRRD